MVEKKKDKTKLVDLTELEQSRFDHTSRSQSNSFSCLPLLAVCMGKTFSRFARST